jgi:AcrR family transcriptional regulator
MPGSSDSLPRDARRLPRGRHGLPRAVVVENQRGRIFESLATVSAAKGYADVTVKDIIDHAGVSRRTFYDLFADKEQCFLAAYHEIVERLFVAVDRAYGAAEQPWPTRLAAALHALVENYASEPDLARLAMVDVLAAGPRALARRDATLRRFAVFFEDGRAGLPATMALQELLSQAVVGGLYEALYGYIIDGQAERLPELMPDLIYCGLVPYLGHRKALAAIEADRTASKESDRAASAAVDSPKAPTRSSRRLKNVDALH